MSDEEQERLVLLAQAGDPRAFDELLRGYERPLFRHILRLLGNEDRAYEALQETFLVVVRNIRRLQSRGSFRPWAYGVATRVCLKAVSRRAASREDLVEPEIEPEDLEPLPDSLVAEREELEAVLQRVLTLSPRVRSVLLLHFFEDLALKEVAAALEISIGTVKSRLAAGLVQLRAAEGGKP